MLVELGIMFSIGFYFAVDIITHLLLSKKVKVITMDNEEYSTFSTTGGMVFKYKFKDIENENLYDSKYITNQVIDNNPFTAFMYKGKIITYRNIVLVLFLSIVFCSVTLYILLR